MNEHNPYASDSTTVGTPTLPVVERQWAAGAHLAALGVALLTTWFAGIGGALGALVVWFLVRDKYAFASEHAKEAFNFNISMFIYAVISIAIAVFTLGIGLLVLAPLWVVLALAWIVLTIIASMKAYEGQHYRYPITLRLMK